MTMTMTAALLHPRGMLIEGDLVPTWPALALDHGGVEQSRFGSMGGRLGLEDLLRPKNVSIPLG